MKAKFSLVNRDKEHNIVFLEDLANHYGSRTITNDAEAVLRHWTHICGNDARVVYKDTDGEWWEIVWDTNIEFTARFRPWHGLVWDKLSRTEQ